MVRLKAEVRRTRLGKQLVSYAIGYQRDESGPSASYVSVYLMIAFTAVAMGMRNAAVRKLGVADLTTTVLTLTITGLAADSSLAGGSNPRWQRRLGSILAMFVGATTGAILVRRSVFAALALGLATTLACSVLILAVKQWGLPSRAPKAG